MKKIKPYEKCLACGSTDMYFAQCGATNMFSQVCNECHTIHQLGMIIPGEVIKTEHKPDDIDDSLMDIEYEVSQLPHYATNKDELEYLERICLNNSPFMVFINSFVVSAETSRSL